MNALNTPIRNLVLMQEAVAKRQDALETAQSRDELSNVECDPMLRIWCRQHDGLTQAILAEPPQTFDDVLAVLIELEGFMDLHMTADPMMGRELETFHEVIAVAVTNCTARLAATFRLEHEPTEAQRTDIDRIAHNAERWAPPPTACDDDAEGR